MKPLTCGGCTACCRVTPSLILHPEAGDDPSIYETVEVGGQTRLRPTGRSRACRYLGVTGCTIYDKRPVSCRVLDCRRMLMDATGDAFPQMNRQIRRQWIARSRYPEVFRAAAKRLGSP